MVPKCEIHNITTRILKGYVETLLQKSYSIIVKLTFMKALSRIACFAF